MKYASFVRLGETCFGVFHQGKIFDLTYQLAGGSSSLKEAIHFGSIPDNTEELESYLANVTIMFIAYLGLTTALDFMQFPLTSFDFV